MSFLFCPPAGSAHLWSSLSQDLSSRCSSQFPTISSYEPSQTPNQHQLSTPLTLIRSDTSLDAKGGREGEKFHAGGRSIYLYNFFSAELVIGNECVIVIILKTGREISWIITEIRLAGWGAVRWKSDKVQLQLSDPGPVRKFVLIIIMLLPVPVPQLTDHNYVETEMSEFPT